MLSIGVLGSLWVSGLKSEERFNLYKQLREVQCPNALPNYGMYAFYAAYSGAGQKSTRSL